MEDDAALPPRELLLKVLKDLDNGVAKPEALILVYTNSEETTVHCSIKTQNIVTMLGMLSLAGYMITERGIK